MPFTPPPRLEITRASIAATLVRFDGHRSPLISCAMLTSVTFVCLGWMAGTGRPVGLGARSCVSMKKTVEADPDAERPQINIALNSIVEFQVQLPGKHPAKHTFRATKPSDFPMTKHRAQKVRSCKPLATSPTDHHNVGPEASQWCSRGGPWTCAWS